MTLADSSAWIAFLRATGSSADRALAALVRGAELATTDVVLMEVLAGARDEDERVRLTRLLYSCVVVPGPLDYEFTAQSYRHCRARGATIRRLNDCLTAVVPCASTRRCCTATASSTSLGLQRAASCELRVA